MIWGDRWVRESYAPPGTLVISRKSDEDYVGAISNVFLTRLPKLGQRSGLCHGTLVPTGSDCRWSAMDGPDSPFCHILPSESYSNNSGFDVRPKILVFAITFPVITALDVVTKRWALAELVKPDHGHDLLGGLVPLTLAFNKGAAFGIRVTEDSRWFFVPVTILALVLLGILYKEASNKDILRISSISLVVSGALGNLYDRVRWDRGVVDFLGPVDLGLWDFPIFNVADMAITCGAILLAISFYLEERAMQTAEDDVREAVRQEGSEPGA